MCFVESQNVALDSPKTPARRERRVLTARQAARREKVVSHLVDPIIVDEDPRLLTDQARDIYEAFKPRNGWQDWLTSEIAVLMVRINRCSRIERKMRDWASYRAIDFWEDDQKVEVETLAQKLHLDPSKVVAQLRQSPTGCDWLTARWRILAKVDPTEWTEGQRTMAGCLVGDDPAVDPTAPGFAADQVAELAEQRQRVEEADAIARGLVEADLSDDKVPNLGRLRRYARSLHTQMKWYIDQFHVEHPDRWDDPRRLPAFLGPLVETADTARKPHWTYAEPKPPTDETKPTPIAETDETKPTSVESHLEIDKTKPTGPAVSVPQAVISEPVVIHDDANEPDRGSKRKHRVNHVRDAAERQKARRRRLALAEFSGS